MVSTRERLRRRAGLFFVLPAFLFVLLFMPAPLVVY